MEVISDLGKIYFEAYFIIYRLEAKGGLTLQYGQL